MALILLREIVVWYKILFLSIPVLFIYHDILYEMGLDWWRDENYSHGFLIPIVSLYLIAKKWDSLKKNSISPSWWGPAVLAWGLFVLIIGVAGAELFTMRISFIFVIMGLILCLFGKEVLKSLSFPIFFLVFMIPLPYIVYNSLTLPLKIIASKLAVYFLSPLGIPVFREGSIIYFPEMTLEVVEACSGIRSLMALIALGTLFSYFFQSSLLRRILLVSSTIPIAILANALRITITGVLAFYLGLKVAHGFFHYLSGWLVFLIAFVCLILINICLNRIKG